MLQYKQVLGEWYWKEEDNLLVHKCSNTTKWSTQQIDSEIRCMYCKEEAPQTVVDICLLCNIKPWCTYKTIKGRWGVEKNSSNHNRPYLAHLCRGKVFPYSCNATQCRKCNTKIPKYIIKYCKENNVEI